MHQMSPMELYHMQPWQERQLESSKGVNLQYQRQRYLGGYASDGYASDGYTCGGHASGGYARGGYASGGYASGGYARGGYANGGYASGGYASGGYVSGSYASGGYASGDIAKDDTQTVARGWLTAGVKVVAGGEIVSGVRAHGVAGAEREVGEQNAAGDEKVAGVRVVTRAGNVAGALVVAAKAAGAQVEGRVENVGVQVVVGERDIRALAGVLETGAGADDARAEDVMAEKGAGAEVARAEDVVGAKDEGAEAVVGAKDSGAGDMVGAKDVVGGNDAGAGDVVGETDSGAGHAECMGHDDVAGGPCVAGGRDVAGCQVTTAAGLEEETPAKLIQETAGSGGGWLCEPWYTVLTTTRISVLGSTTVSVSSLSSRLLVPTVALAASAMGLDPLEAGAPPLNVAFEVAAPPWCLGPGMLVERRCLAAPATRSSIFFAMQPVVSLDAHTKYNLQDLLRKKQIG
ncbi:unnamed protein product [Closterium sp. NIES-65]|nr:unnamed protein product [Closterium sp. NIES-65]